MFNHGLQQVSDYLHVYSLSHLFVGSSGSSHFVSLILIEHQALEKKQTQVDTQKWSETTNAGAPIIFIAYKNEEGQRHGGSFL